MRATECQPVHPLDPCSGDELKKAASLLRSTGQLSDNAAFSCGFLHEPPKGIVLGFQPGKSFEREVRLIGHDPAEKKSFDAIVSVTHEKLVELTWIEDGQAPVSSGDYIRLLRLIGKNEDWAGALKKRGIEDLSLVHVEPWVSGVRHPTQAPDARTLRALAFVHEHPRDNHYARPVEGLIAFADFDKGTVVGDSQGTDSAPMVAPGIAAPIHQHQFCFRLDFNVDGAENSVCEMEVEPLPSGPENPHDSGFRSVARVLKTEQEAKRELAPERSSNWRVINPNRTNRYGNPVGYKLMPQASAPLFAGPGSLHRKRAGFASHNLWVTPYAHDELYADAGPFANLHSGAAGLPIYTQQNRNTENTDIVVWHTFGVTHVPRPEDWRVMPVEYTGFTLMPVGFFDRNPALDVAPSKHCVE